MIISCSRRVSLGTFNLFNVKFLTFPFLYIPGDRFLQAANACRYWPSGRGIYHNDAKTFLIWCNEEDHLRIISMQMGGNLGEVFRRLSNAVNDIEKRIPFSHNDRLGFVSFTPLKSFAYCARF